MSRLYRVEIDDALHIPRRTAVIGEGYNLRNNKGRLPSAKAQASIEAGADLARRAREAEAAWEKPLPHNTPRKHKKWAREEKILSEERAKYHNLAVLADSMCSRTKARARAIGVPFSITPKWILARLVNMKCEVTGVPFDFHGEDKGNGGRSMFCPSLDQKIPSAGYTKENVQIVVWCYNAAKGTGTDADVARMAEALLSQRPWAET
jgi:hypothetical protein